MRTFAFTLLLLLCFSGFYTHALGGECENWQQNHSDWLWCDDFESSDTNLNHRYEDVGSEGLSIVSNEGLDGTQSLQQHYNPKQVDAGWVCHVKDQGFPDHIFMRWYHKFEPGFQGYPEKMARIRYRDRTIWISSFAVHCWLQPDGVLALDVLAKNSSQANDVGWLSMARSTFTFASNKNIGRWICFEMEVKLNTSGNKDGLYRLWADDSLLVERMDVDLRGNTSEKINEAELDCYWGEGSPKSQNRYYDNFVISTKKIGLFDNAKVIDEKTRKLPLKKRPNQSLIKILRGNGMKPTGILLLAPPGQIVLSMYDVLGKKIRTLFNGQSKDGVVHIPFENANYPSTGRGLVVFDMNVDGKDAYRSCFVY
jgi:hypothetical protein